jgi:AcrR family transcriptional regulator
MARRSPRERLPRKPQGRYHHGELRQALVSTALAVIEREGVGALSLRDLSRRLGVSHAAPAHHFRDRAALLGAIAREGFERLSAAMTAASEASAPDARLEAIGRAYVRFALEHPASFRVMFGRELSELEAPPPELAEAGRRAFALLVEAVREPLAGQAPAGRAAAEDVAFTCWSLVHGAATLWIDGPLRCAGPPAEARASYARGLAFSLDLLGRALDAAAAPRRR